MPLTENGFERLTYEDILTKQIERAKLLFGEEIDTSDQSIFGKILRLYCLDASENQELAESVYLSAFPNTARGTSLDRVCSLIGISRNSESYAQHEIIIKGTAGTVIEMGFFVSAGDIVFHTVEDYTIGSDGTVTAVVECNEAGTIGNVPDGTISSIVNPIPNVTGIEHTQIIRNGKGIETDYQLRNRFSESLSAYGSGTMDAIQSAVLRVDGVEMVLLQEFDGGFNCYVLCNRPSVIGQAIAEAIFSKKPIGVRSAGKKVYAVKDISGRKHDIGFSLVQEKNIYVRCTVKLEDGVSESLTIQAIKENIVNKLSTYKIWQKVTATSLYSEVFVDGVSDVTNLEIKMYSDDHWTNVVYSSPEFVLRTLDDQIEVTISSE